MSADLQDQYDKIFRYCFFKVKNQELAEDLTQEAFLRYFRQSPSISHGKPLDQPRQAPRLPVHHRKKSLC